jgi:hypothetical protein
MTKNAVGMVARMRKISLSLFALAKAITIPNIPTAIKYHPNPFFMLFSIVVFDVLLCRSRLQRDKEVSQATSLTYLEILSSREALSRFRKYLSHRSFTAKGK